MATNIFMNNQQPQTTTLITAQSDQWSTGILGCCDDMDICCFGCWCFPCFTCDTASRFGECFCLPLLDMCAFRFCLPSCANISMSMRVAVRYRYKIQGDMTGDCMYATFCTVCSWCQVAREIKRRSVTFTLVNAQPAYIGVQEGLVATQPAVVSAQPVVSVISQENL
ncbi:cornifelin-like [Mastacembelus armatus]|uniref:cornifelin-like n=1 Tax=Mastacembelus armatus TaxID=205130 RepID=UPI000E464145|nr:cornifelin-like [Mastacembelus armatus]